MYTQSLKTFPPSHSCAPIPSQSPHSEGGGGRERSSLVSPRISLPLFSQRSAEEEDEKTFIGLYYCSKMRKTRKEIRQRRGKTWGEKKKRLSPGDRPAADRNCWYKEGRGKRDFFYFPSSPSLVLIHPHLACKKRREEVDWRGREKEEEEASIKVKMGGREKVGGGGKRISRVSPI